MAVTYKDKKEFLKWLSENLFQLDKFTTVTPAPGETEDSALVCVDIGTENIRLTVELDKDRLGIIDLGLHCLSIGQKMSGEPIKVNGKSN